MRRWKNRIFSGVILAMTILTVLILAFVIYFIVKEALPTFQEVKLTDFLFGQRWMPIAYTGEVSFGIFNFIMATRSFFPAWRRKECVGFSIPLSICWRASRR